MKKNTFLQIITVLAVMFLVAGCVQQPVDVSGEISDANIVFMEAFNTGDMAALAQCYTEDAKLFPPNSEIVQGREMIETFWGGALEMGVKKVLLETTSATGFGNTAIEEGKATLYAEGDVILDVSKYIVIWKKIGDKWLLDRDIWNSSMPPPEPPEPEPEVESEVESE
ncbi:MAG: DUF4440 domain-containing protein [Bacteroidales bacterium]|nr:DUF4440 domain-containing protein [Bacteroidales bacterium]